MTSPEVITVERWRMLSGRVASIDLTGHPDAVEGARELLCMNGATRIDYAEPVQAFAGDEYDEVRAQRAARRASQKNALDAGGNQPEGTKTNSERNDPMTTVQRSVASIRERLEQRGMTVDDLEFGGERCRRGMDCRGEVGTSMAELA